MIHPVIEESTPDSLEAACWKIYLQGPLQNHKDCSMLQNKNKLRIFEPKN